MSFISIRCQISEKDFKDVKNVWGQNGEMCNETAMWLGHIWTSKQRLLLIFLLGPAPLSRSPSRTSTLTRGFPSGASDKHTFALDFLHLSNPSVDLGTDTYYLQTDWLVTMDNSGYRVLLGQWKCSAYSNISGQRSVKETTVWFIFSAHSRKCYRTKQLILQEWQLSVV